MTEQQLNTYIEAIHYNSKFAAAYCNLGATIAAACRGRPPRHDWQCLRRPEQDIGSRRACHASRRPHHDTTAAAYQSHPPRKAQRSLLRPCWDHRSEHQAPRRPSNTRQDLYVEAIHQDVDFAEAYLELGKAMWFDESVKLRDDRRMTKQQLFIEAIHHDDELAEAYVVELGKTLAAGESITLCDGRRMSREDLLAFM
jgi:hypothetical protein